MAASIGKKSAGFLTYTAVIEVCSKRKIETKALWGQWSPVPLTLIDLYSLFYS